LFALGGALLLFLPWVPIAVHQTVTVSGGFWISEESILDPFHTLIFFQSNIGASLLTWWQQVLFGVTFLFMGVWYMWRIGPIPNIGRIYGFCWEGRLCRDW
jgi:hypothetical protein